MCKTRCCGCGFCTMAIVGTIGFAAWKLVHLWHAGIAEKTGHTVDASIRAAAENLEKTALKLEEWVKQNPGESMGKGIDDIVEEARNTLDKTTDTIQNVLKKGKKE